MTFEKPSLYKEFVISGDIRCLMALVEKYNYTDEEVSKVINIYNPDEFGRIPEVEHIEVLLSYFPKSVISEQTMCAIKTSFPNRFEYITKLRKMSINT